MAHNVSAEHLLITSTEDYVACQPPVSSQYEGFSQQTAGSGQEEATILFSIVLRISFQHFSAQTVDGNYRNQPLSTEDCDAS